MFYRKIFKCHKRRVNILERDCFIEACSSVIKIDLFPFKFIPFNPHNNPSYANYKNLYLAKIIFVI
jgi:hypothetical protein